MRILIIRHAEPDYAADSLTPKGRQEAELLSRRLAKYNIHECWVSPYGRARDTAAYTLEKTGLTAVTLPWLAEFRGRYTDREGHTEIPWDLPPRDWYTMPLRTEPDRWADDPRFAGGTVRAVWEETKAGTDALMARYGFRKDGPVWVGQENRDITVALFCHFGIGMAVLAYLTDVSPMILWQRTICLPSSVTEVMTEERVKGEVFFRVTKLGDLSHLEMNGEKRSTYGMYPEIWTGIDSTDPTVNGTLPAMRKTGKKQ